MVLAIPTILWKLTKEITVKLGAGVVLWVVEMPIIRNRVIGGDYQHGNLYVWYAIWISYHVHPMSIDFSLQVCKTRPQYSRGPIRYNTCGLTCGDILKAQSSTGRGGSRQICVVSRLVFIEF